MLAIVVKWVAVACVLSLAGAAFSQPDDYAVHQIGELWSTAWNAATYGDPWGDYPSCDWPGSTGNGYLWDGSVCTFAYGAVTVHGDSVAKWSSSSEYGSWELRCSDGYPLEYLTPGPVAPEQSQFAADDWDLAYNPNPYGLMVWIENYSWDNPGYDDFMASKLVFTHHSEHGNPGAPLNAFVMGIKGDCDVATSDSVSIHLDDMVYYDGHAIWCNDPTGTFDYTFFDGTSASTRDIYTYQQNPDASYPDPDDNIYYQYNYLGPDGLVDADVDANGVSDHFTILAKVVGPDTTYILDEDSGVLMFSEGMPPGHWQHTVGDSTYLVVPRNLTYMWDTDRPSSPEDDSGEWDNDPPCNGFVGWRLLDCWVKKAGGYVLRPMDVNGYTIPLCHTWWDWENDPATDTEKYDFAWSATPFGITPLSGPEYISNWVGDPSAPEAFEPGNLGPYPFVSDPPVEYGYPVHDYRFFISVGPANLDDGDSLFVMGGWVVGKGLDGLRRNADLMLDAYWRSSVWGGAVGIHSGPDPEVPELSIRVCPSPATVSAVAVLRLPEASSVPLDVFDLSGRLVLGQSTGELTSGEHSVWLDLSSFQPGLYFVRVRAGNSSATGRFVVLR